MVKVSVLMPAYNTDERYLREAIESILSQTFRDFEFIILNDASPNENVEKVILSYKDERIKYFKNETNLGISRSRNRLMDLAQGEYLAVFDHDDISHPERLKKEVEYLDSHSDVGVVGTWYNLVDKPDKTVAFPIESDDIKIKLAEGCYVHHTSSMIRKKVLDEHCLQYEEKYTPAEDYALWCRLISKTNFANIPEVLVSYREHETNTSKRFALKSADAALRINAFTSIKHPALLVHAENQRIFVKRYRLFNLFPLLKVRTQGKHTTWYLLGLIPIMKIKKYRAG